MAQLIVSVVVKGEPWEVRRFDVEGWFHRQPHGTVWLPGIPPGASIEGVQAAYERVANKTMH